MKQQTILIVDDEPTWLKLLGRFFACNGYKVLTSPSCARAIKAVRLNSPDCVVLDFHLSDGDAAAVCAEIRAREGRRIPIVIFSSDPEAEDCVGGECRADRFILKITPLEKLLAAVNELLAAAE